MLRFHLASNLIKDEVESVVIQNNTKMQPVVLPFSYKDISIMSSLPILASLQDVSLEQLVEVKAKPTRLTAVKTQTTILANLIRSKKLF